IWCSRACSRSSSSACWSRTCSFGGSSARLCSAGACRPPVDGRRSLRTNCWRLITASETSAGSMQRWDRWDCIGRRLHLHAEPQVTMKQPNAARGKVEPRSTPEHAIPAGLRLLPSEHCAPPRNQLYAHALLASEEAVDFCPVLRQNLIPLG